MKRRIPIVTLALLAALLFSLAGGIPASAAEEKETGGNSLFQAFTQTVSEPEEPGQSAAGDKKEPGEAGEAPAAAADPTAAAAEPEPEDPAETEAVPEPAGENAAQPFTGKQNAAFVRAAARAVTVRKDGPELFFAGEDAYWCDLESAPTLQPYFALLRFRAQADKDDPSLVHYSCRIPGAVGACFNMAYDACFQANPRYSKWVPVEGNLRIVTDENGNRQIDISRGDNAFAAYAALRYINPLFFQVSGIDISGGLSDADFSDGLNILLNRSCDAYASLLGMTSEAYADEVVIPELQDYEAHMATIVRLSTSSGYGFWNFYHGLSLTTKTVIFVLGGGLILFALLVLVVAVSGSIKDRKEGKVKEKHRSLPRDVVSNDRGAPELLDGLARISSFSFSSFGSFCGRFQTQLSSFSEMEDVQSAAGMAVVLAQKPESADAGESTLRFLCKNIHLGLRLDAYSASDESRAEAYRHELLTAAGWSAAALGRLLAKTMSPGDIAANLERLSPAIDKSNEILDRLREQYGRREELSKKLSRLQQSPDGSAPDGMAPRQLMEAYQAAQEEVEDLEREYSKGLGGFMLDNGDLPLAYLIFLLRDSQNRFPRFIKQGVIMGLVDWLMENKSHSEAEKLLQTVVSVRADMIRSDSELTFFEVRAPKRCSRKDYAVLLRDVLHCANPALTFGDTEELLSIAEKEVPGVMDMLYACPLRLIDPANRQTLGFYQFKPYIHAMWVQYVPPLRTGQVISRYHEVDDRTKPLSSGLQLALFRDCYAVIPTLYHENQHFRGDRNEASVFLKTQIFSIRFYKKYKQANAKADGVFAQLTTLLGLPPAADKRGALNALIERYYGRQVSLPEAQKKADAEISSLNRFVDGANAQETWDPDKKLPRLSDQEDKKNRDLIRDIVIRFATVPKSITEQEFDDILKGRADALQELAGLPLSPALEQLGKEYGKNKGVDFWLHRILSWSMGQSLGLEGIGAEGEETLRLLRSNGLDPADCYQNLQAFLFDPSSDDPKSLPKYLRLAGRQAQAENASVLKPEHLLYVLLRHPTKAMKNAGITGKKR